MKLKNFFLFFMLIILFPSCKEDVKVAPLGQQFFDLKSYFAEEQTRLKSIKEVVKKSVVNGKSEEKTVSNVDFEEELALFIDSDINKVAWLDKYSVDSTYTNKQLNGIAYHAKDDQLKTKSMTVQFEQGAVSHITIYRETSSIAASLEQTLTYTPAEGYIITSQQKTIFSSSHALALTVQFVP